MDTSMSRRPTSRNVKCIQCNLLILNSHFLENYFSETAHYLFTVPDRKYIILIINYKAYIVLKHKLNTHEFKTQVHVFIPWHHFQYYSFSKSQGKKCLLFFVYEFMCKGNINNWPEANWLWEKVISFRIDNFYFGNLAR